MATSIQIHRHFSLRNHYHSEGIDRLKIKAPLIRRCIPNRKPNAKSTRLSVVMRLEGSNMEARRPEASNPLMYPEDKAREDTEDAVKSYPTTEEAGKRLGMDNSVKEEDITPVKKSAKIHDFCLGIPFGGIVLSGGFVGFLFSRNPVTLTTGLLFGGVLLVLSFYSLKVWRQGKSSLPFILGQAAFAAALLWKQFQAYSMTKKLFPSGFYAIMSAAMLCFYSYVLISGGNPPPKKLRLATPPPS